MSERILFALIGVIVGGLAGSFFTKRFVDKEYRKRIEDLEAENKQLKAKKRRAKAKDISEREENARVKEAEIDTSIHAQITKAREERRQTAELVKEHGYSDSDEEEDEEFDADEDVEFDDPFDSEGESVVVKKPVESKKPVFSMLSQKDYEDDFEYRDSESLTYYQEDHVLADAFDDRVGNPEMIIGEAALKEADDTQEDYVYVLDETENKMYEIEVNHEESYYRDIVGGGGHMI